MSGLGANMRKGSFAGDALGMGGLNPYSNFALGGPGFGLAGSAFGGLVPLNSMSMQMQMPSQFSGRSGRADSFSAAFGGVSPREVAYSHVRVCCCCVATIARGVLCCCCLSAACACSPISHTACSLS